MKSIILSLIFFATTQCLVAQITNEWDGSENTDWMEANNWSLNLVPTNGHYVEIPANLTNYPSLDDSVTVSRVQLFGNAQLHILDTGALYIEDGGSYGLNIHQAGTGGMVEIDMGGLISIKDFAVDGLRVSGGSLINNGTITIDSCGHNGINLQPQYNPPLPPVSPNFINRGAVHITNVNLSAAEPPYFGIRAHTMGAINDTCGLIYSDFKFSLVENKGSLILDNAVGNITLFEDNHPTGILHIINSNQSSILGDNHGLINTDAALRIWDGCAQNSSWESPNNWSRNTIPSVNDNIHIQDRGRSPIVDTELDTLTGFLFTIDSTAEISIADGGRLTMKFGLYNYGKFNVLSGGEFGSANNFYNYGSGVFTNHGNADVRLFSNEGSLFNHGILSTTDLYNYGYYQNMPCGISDIMDGLYASDSIVKNEGLIRMHSDNFQQSNGDYQEYGYQVDTNDVLPDLPQLLYSFDRMISEEFFYSDPNNNGISLCAGDTSDLSNQSLLGAFPLRCDYVYYGTNTWQNNEVELYEDCVDYNSYDYSGNTWFQFHGTGDSIQITGKIIENTSEIHFYEDSQNGLICLGGFYDFSLSDTINLLTEYGKIYYLRLGTYQSEPEITEFEIHLNCFCTDEPIVYESPNDFYNGNNITVSSDSTVVGANILFQGAQISYSGAEGVILNPQFEIKSGALFEAKTDGCP